jgi:ABC-type multidrug transport system permease subunit
MVYGQGIWNGAFWLNVGILAAWGVAGFLIGSRFFNWKAEKR